MTYPTDALPVDLGTQEDGTVAFRAEEELLKTHMAVFGGTRYGKSKLFELICRQLLMRGQGFAFIDPHSDTTDDLLSYLAFHAKDRSFICKRVRYLKPDERLFSFDPFRYHPSPSVPEGNSEFRYRTWLNTKIKDVVKIITRQQGETEDEAQKMVRLRRWLYNALYAVGVRQDAEGTHLPMSDAFILLNPQHPRHSDLYDLVEPFLEDTVRSDFAKLRATRDPRKQEEWVESTFNRLRDILSPLVQRIFNLEAPSIDFHEIVQGNGIILASLGKTKYFHEDEALTIAGLLIREISEAVRTVERARRRQFYLFMDEAQNFLGEDLIRLLKESAKYKLSVGLAVQSLDNLQKGDIDLVPSVLGQCGVRITFRQQFHEHAEVLAKCLCYPLLDFTELLHDVDRDNGYDFVLMPSESVGRGDNSSLSYGRTESTNKGTARTQGITRSTQESESEARSRSETESETSVESYSHGESTTEGKSIGSSRQHTTGRTQDGSETSGTSQSQTLGHQQALGLEISSTEGEQRSTTSREGVSESDSVGESETYTKTHSKSQQWGESQSEGHASTRGKTVTKGQGQGEAIADSTSENKSTGESESASLSKGRSGSHSMTLALTPLHKTRREFQKTGKLDRSISDQTAEHTHMLQSLEKQHCLVAVASLNSTFVLRVDDVRDPFDEQIVSPEWRCRQIQQLKEAIFERHPCFFRFNDAVCIATITFPLERQLEFPVSGAGGGSPSDN